jgi:MYXO-CTERM domain-containing protein
VKRFVSILTVGILVQSAAIGGTVAISGSGTWNASTLVTDVSAPDATWSFSFDVNSPVPTDDSTPAAVTNASYLLNGTPVVSEALTTVIFFDSGFDGMFDLNFSIPGSSGDTVNLYGAQVFDSSGNLIPGSYQANSDVNLTAGPPSGSGSGTVLIETVTTIPEPSSIISGGIAAAALAGLGLVRRRVVACRNRTR